MKLIAWAPKSVVMMGSCANGTPRVGNIQTSIALQNPCLITIGRQLGTRNRFNITLGTENGHAPHFVRQT